MQNTLIDNSSNFLSMTYCLQNCIKTEGLNEIKIATGYWDIPGIALVVDALHQFLEQEGAKLKLLIGREMLVYANQILYPSVDDTFPQDFMKQDLERLRENIKPAYQKVINLLMTNCENGKIEIRKYDKDVNGKPQFLHAKCYIFNGVSTRPDGNKEDFAYGIIGSSNFTEQGLKNSDNEKGNRELNYLEINKQIVNYTDSGYGNCKGHNQWFDEIWELATPWDKEYLEQVLKPAKITQIPIQADVNQTVATLTPYETYIKYLQMYFGDITDERLSDLLKSYLPADFHAYEFQLDAVKQCFHIMHEYGGFFLADVVGLGKTVVALLIIKRFIEENTPNQQGESPKVLIIVPPAVRKAWEDTIQAFDKDTHNKIGSLIKIITTGSIGHIMDEELETDLTTTDEIEDLPQENYGLIMIDESHNFRNNTTQKYHALDSLIDHIEQQTGKRPFIGLMSATPQNNSPKDLRNQIYLFERTPQKSHFVSVQGRLDSYFKEKQSLFDQYRRDSSPEAKIAIKDLASDIRQKILNHIVVRRTRTDIIKYYDNDTTHLHFPTVCPPHKLVYEMDDEMVTLFKDTIDIILPPNEGEPDQGQHLGYYRYMAIKFFCDSKNTRLYGRRNLTVENITERLAKIMRIMLVKRLESSCAAFRSSLVNLLQYTKNMLDMLNNDCVFICPDVDVNAEFQKANYNFEKASSAIRAKIEKKRGNNREFRSNDFSEEYRQLLQADYALLEKLCERWKNNYFDPKFDTFKEILTRELFNPTINNPHGYDEPRLVIFTEAINTQKELVRYLQSKKYKVLSVSASTRNELQQKIIHNFDANSETRLDDYNVLVTTEVLAEGVNLHRANVILNYDTPWNTTRLMQRIGRVNRIGSKEDCVHVFNFFPTAQSNQHIHLIEIANAKLQSFHNMFGEDNKVFSENEELSEANFNNKFNDEESAFAPYLKDLKQYAKENPQRYQQICDMEAKKVGGQLTHTGDTSFMVVASDKQRQACIQLSENDTSSIAPLQLMQQLKEHTTEQYHPTDDEQYNILASRAIHYYKTIINKSLTGKDSQKNIKDALRIANEIAPLLNKQEAQEALKKASDLIRAGHSTAIRIMKKYNEQLCQTTLLDIDEWILTMFGNIHPLLTHQNEPYIALYQI